ncbi:MAG: hypothetical protein K0T99_02410 [Alphaproteobacteria bacterium]|nr:hypothetical protein [Alphaproteobacteria bacterium]
MIVSITCNLASTFYPKYDQDIIKYSNCRSDTVSNLSLTNNSTDPHNSSVLRIKNIYNNAALRPDIPLYNQIYALTPHDVGNLIFTAFFYEDPSLISYNKDLHDIGFVNLFELIKNKSQTSLSTLAEIDIFEPDTKKQLERKIGHEVKYFRFSEFTTIDPRNTTHHKNGFLIQDKNKYNAYTANYGLFPYLALKQDAGNFDMSTQEESSFISYLTGLFIQDFTENISAPPIRCKNNQGVIFTIVPSGQDGCEKNDAHRLSHLDYIDYLCTQIQDPKLPIYDYAFHINCNNFRHYIEFGDNGQMVPTITYRNLSGGAIINKSTERERIDSNNLLVISDEDKSFIHSLTKIFIQEFTYATEAPPIRCKNNHGAIFSILPSGQDGCEKNDAHRLSHLDYIDYLCTRREDLKLPIYDYAFHINCNNFRDYISFDENGQIIDEEYKLCFNNSSNSDSDIKIYLDKRISDTPLSNDNLPKIHYFDTPEFNEPLDDPENAKEKIILAGNGVEIKWAPPAD